MTEDAFIATSTVAGIALDPNFYESKITAIEADDGQYGPQYKITFTVDEHTRDDGTPITVFGWTGRTITPNTKLGKWLAKLDCFPPRGTAFDVRSLIGYRCRLVIAADDDGRSVLAGIEATRHELTAFTPEGAPIYDIDEAAAA